MKRLALSSEFYYIKARDLKKTPVKEKQIPNLLDDEDCVFIKLHHNGAVTVYSGLELLDSVNDDEFVKTRVVYISYPAFIGFLLNLIKPIKRRFYIKSTQPFIVRLQDILDAKLPRGERNAENAYQFANKRYYLNKEDAQKCYQKLYQSIEQNGYDFTKPMYVMLNRKLGIKDQLLQGHHRIGICKDLGVKEISISFWAAPASFDFFRFFIPKNKK